MIDYAAAQRRLVSLDGFEPTDADIRTNMAQYAAARVRLLRKPARSTSEEAGGTARGNTATATSVADVSGSTPARVPTPPVEAAAPTPDERARVPDPPIEVAASTPDEPRGGRVSPSRATDVGLISPPAGVNTGRGYGQKFGANAQHKDDLERNARDLLQRLTAGFGRSDSPQDGPERRMSSEASMHPARHQSRSQSPSRSATPRV